MRPSFRASAIFGFKKLLISGIKKHNPDGPGSISYVSESSEQASESKFDFTLQKKKQKQKTNKQTFAQIVWCVTKRFQMLSEDNFKIVTYPTVPSGHHNRSQRVSLLAPVVQTLDSAIHQINHYPADSVIDFRNTYPLDSDLSGG